MRRPAAAGTFYPADEKQLRQEVESLLRTADEDNGRFAVTPHAGYPYSGRLSASSCKGLRNYDTYVLVGPNHTGRGAPIALSGQTWRTPLGDVPVDTEIVDELDFPVDESAHVGEHSLEVQLPFLQSLHDSFSIVPITMKDQSREVVERVAEQLQPFTDRVGILASSDLTHYQPLDEAEARDRAFIDAVLSLDVDGLYTEAATGSQCGYGPVAVVIELAKRTGADPRLLGYTTSAEATGDASSVVGYTSILFT